MTEAAALGRPLDEPGDVGEHELVLVEAHDAEVRLEGRERIVADLRPGRAHRRDQRRLARVREPDERGVGHELQLEPQPALLAVLALLGERRRPAGVRQEPGVAASAPAAVGGEERVAVVDEVGEQLAALVHAHDRALGDGHREVACRPCRASWPRRRGCPARPCGAGGHGTRAATRRCGRPGSRRRRPCRRRRRRDRRCGTCASRRNATEPAPPSPPFTFSWASSTKLTRTSPRRG